MAGPRVRTEGGSKAPTSLAVRTQSSQLSKTSQMNRKNEQKASVHSSFLFSSGQTEEDSPGRSSEPSWLTRPRYLIKTMAQPPGYAQLPGVGEGRLGRESPLDTSHCQVWGRGGRVGTAPGQAPLPGVRSGPGPLETLWRTCGGPQIRQTWGAVGQSHPSPPNLIHFTWPSVLTFYHFLSQPLCDKVVSSCRPPVLLLQQLTVPEESILSASHLTPSAAFASGAQTRTHCHILGQTGDHSTDTQPPEPGGPVGCPIGGHKRAMAEEAESEGHMDTLC